MENNNYNPNTTFETNEEIILENGEWVIGVEGNFDNRRSYRYIIYKAIFDKPGCEHGFRDNNERIWDFIVRKSDFDINNLEETKKHILCVKDGKITRYEK